MPEAFLHGVEVIEVDNGSRPIRTAKSAVIGIVGTAPSAAPAVAAVAVTGVAVSNHGLLYTAKVAGLAGNGISVQLLDPAANSRALSVSVSAKAIVVSLATSASGAVTSTAAQVLAAVNAKAEAAALVVVSAAAGSTGAGVVLPALAQALQGGANEPFPLNTPVLIAGSRLEAAKLDAVGTGLGSLPASMDDIFDQVGALVIVVRVAHSATAAAEKSNIITGIQALLDAESVLGYSPRILIAPGYSSDQAVATELDSVCGRLRAVAFIDGPSTDYAASIAYAGNFGSKRLYMVDPAVKVWSTTANAEVIRPASARAAGVQCWSDNERGFWWSPSNNEIKGIIGTERPIDFKMGDANSRANLLNEQNIATIIRQNGYRLWGNRTLSADPKWAFLCVVRTADMIHDALQRSHLWAVDRNINKTYLGDVVEGVNNYLRHLTSIGAILGGKAWADPELNSPSQLQQGKVYIDFDFTASAPAEHITFRSHLVNDYYAEIV